MKKKKELSINHVLLLLHETNLEIKLIIFLYQ